MLTPVNVADVNLLMRELFGNKSVECTIIDFNDGREFDYIYRLGYRLRLIE